MDEHADRRRALARAWDEAAEGYERYFVPRFAPWVAAGVSALTAPPLPPGPLLVPCCGTFPELPALVEAYPDREIVGIDLSPGMVDRARARAEGHPGARVVVGDAVTLDSRWTGACAGVVSVFGLQQLPDPRAALRTWSAALRPDGVLSVVFWTAMVDPDGPFALMDHVLAGVRPPLESGRDDGLDGAIAAGGARIEHDDDLAFPMRHPDAATYWDATTSGGSHHAWAVARGPEVVRALREEFLRLAPAGEWQHRPRARWIIARRP